MPARHIDSIHDRYELQPTPRCQSSTSLSCSFASGGWREGWGAEEPGGGRRVLNFIILPRGGGPASCCCCSLLPAPTEPLPTPALSSQAGPSWHWRGFYFIPCHQLSSDISAHWTDRHFSATKTLPAVSRTRWRYCFHIEMWVWKCTAAVSYLSWFAANSAQSGLGQAASRGLTAARRPAAPAQPSLSPRANVFLGLAVIC